MSIGIIMLFTWRVHPFLFCFTFELIRNYIPLHRKELVRFVVMMLPITIADESIRMTYGLIVAFSFLVLTIADRYISRVVKLESQNDKMRKDMQRLTKSLHENKEYIRQSEYTFKLEERNRLSQEIHDKIGHSMTGALIQMEAAKG